MRRVFAAALVAVVAYAGLASSVGTSDVASAQATTTAIVAIDNGANTYWVSVDVGGGQTGLQTLDDAVSLDSVPFAGFGAAVCAIDGVGNPESSCLTGPNGAYWSYWRSPGGGSAWTYSGAGGASTTVHGGDVEGWHYIDSSIPRAQAAPRLSPRFCDYVGSCAPPPTDPPPPPPPAEPIVVPATSGGNGSAPSPGTTAATGPSAPTDARAKGGDGASGSDGGGPASEAEGTAKGNGDGSAAGSPDGIGGSDSKAAGRQIALGQRAASADGGSGSPIGVVIVAGILLVVATVFVAQRRRGRSAPGP